MFRFGLCFSSLLIVWERLMEVVGGASCAEFLELHNVAGERARLVREDILNLTKLFI